jgi:hypothetical protein
MTILRTPRERGFFDMTRLSRQNAEVYKTDASHLKRKFGDFYGNREMNSLTNYLVTAIRLGLL